MDVFLQRLIDAATKGEAADFCAERVLHQQGFWLEPKLDSKDVRRLLLGRRNSSEDPASFFPAECCRWEIRGATIEGHLDLRDARLPSGAPLPALHFKDCTFKQGFCADGAHLERLCFHDCRFGANPGNPDAAQISLSGIRVESELRLCGVEALTFGGFVRVNANAAHVGANCIVERTMLRAPENRDNETPLETPYALNLRNAVVRADLLLQPDVSLHGGLLAVGVHVGGDLRAIGMAATDGADDDFRKRMRDEKKELRRAIALDAAHISGNLVLGALEDGKNVDVTGYVSLRMARIGAQIYCVSLNLNRALNTDISRLDVSIYGVTAKALSFSNIVSTGMINSFEATISGTYSLVHCSFGAFDAGKLNVGGDVVLTDTTFAGAIDFRGATTKDLTFSHVVVEGTAEFFEVNVAGRFSLGDCTFATIQAGRFNGGGDVVLTKTKCKGRITFSNATVKGMYLSDVVADRAAEFFEVTNSGGFSLTDCTFETIGASKLTCGGNVALTKTTTKGTATFEGSAIKGTWMVRDSTFDSLMAPGIIVEGDSYLDGDVRREIDLSGATLNSKLDLTQLRFPFGPRLSQSLPGSNSRLQMRDTDIKRALEVGSRRRMDVTLTFVAARIHRPICYRNNITVVEVKATLDTKKQPPAFLNGRDVEDLWVAFLVRRGARAVVLNGSSVPFHDLNQRGLLELDTDEQRKDYVRLFCAYLRGDYEGKESAFRIVESKKQIYGLKSDGKTVIPPVRQLTITEVLDTSDNGTGTFRTITHMSYHSSIFETRLDLHTAKPATIHMEEDAPKLEVDPNEQPQYSNPFKFGNNSDHSDYEVHWQNIGEYALGRLVPIWKDAFLIDGINVGQVDLTDASCGTLNDLDGSGWGSNPRFSLQNFTYNRIEPNPNSSRHKVGFWWQAVVSDLRFSSFFLSEFLQWAGRKSGFHGAIVKIQPIFLKWRRWWRNSVDLPTRSQAPGGQGTWFENLVKSGMPATGVEHRLIWLEQRANVKNYDQPEPFKQQPYAHLAKVLREQGDEADARKVEERGIQIERWSRAKRSVAGKLALPFWGLYRFFFMYGLSPFRAMATFVVCILVGWKGAVYANNQHLLVAKDAAAVSASGTAGAAAAGIRAHEEAAGDGSLKGFLYEKREDKNGMFDSPIRGLLYAADVFIPLVGLGQESHYDVRARAEADKSPVEELHARRGQGIAVRLIGFFKGMWCWPPAWQAMKAAYAVVGRIVTSLTILTVAGTLRKWEVK